MYCKNCGSEISSDQRFCVSCGFENNPFANTNSSQVNNQTVYETYATNYISPETEYSMKWYKFLIYFALFFGALINVAMGLNFINGFIYYVQTNGAVTADEVYALFGSDLQMIDILYGVVLLAIAAFGIVTRFKLANYKKCAPMMVYILYGSGVAISLFYTIAVCAVTGLEITDSSQFSSIAASVAALILNYKYFSKRAALFNN